MILNVEINSKAACMTSSSLDVMTLGSFLVVEFKTDILTTLKRGNFRAEIPRVIGMLAFTFLQTCSLLRSTVVPLGVESAA